MFRLGFFFKNPRKLNKFNLSLRFTHRFLFDMEKAYLRHGTDREHFEISFEYKNEEPKLVRAFNFSRKLSESLESFLGRVTTNVDKVLNKKVKNKKGAPSSAVVASTAVLLVNDCEVSKETICEEVFRPGSNISLQINEKKFTVIVNSPWIEKLELPNSLLATFPTYPAKFEAALTEKNLSDFIWYKSKDKNVWEEIGRNYIYIPSTSDIDYYLKLVCIPKNEESAGPAVESVTSCKVQASPGFCPFETRHAFTKEKTKGKEFRVVSYNILADLYCDSDFTRTTLFPYCPPYALSIDYRKQLFTKEIIGYNADLICLQEVDSKIFKYDLEPTLSHLGYQSNFVLKGTDVAEGLAFFYNKNRFILLESEKLLFSERINKDPIFGDIWERIEKNPKLAERILARTTTLQVNIVGSLDYDEVLVVANTHLYFHPDSDHIRLLHGCLAIRYLEHVVSQLKERYPQARVSLVFCGDFNSVPECGIYKLYTTGTVPGNFIDYSSNKEEAIENITISQNFKLNSACGTPKYTNFTAAFADCLDYIFYETTNLGICQVVPLPSDEELTEHTAIPSIVFPSDHIALISDLKWL